MFIKCRDGRKNMTTVNIETMSLQEFKSGSGELKIWYGIHETMFGNCLLATTSRGLCNLYFLETTDALSDEQDDQIVISQLRKEWTKAEIISDRHKTQSICDRIFSYGANLPNLSDDSHPPLTIYLKGTNFQIQVWRALLQIPFGATTTYQKLGRSLGYPHSARAIGNAVGRNPISYLIPCHRVIRESGEVGGYRWGLERKIAILEWEVSQHKTERS